MKKAIMVALGALILTACQHENPLKTQSKNNSVKFLMNASANAEKRAGFAIQKDSYGYGYLECMDGKKSPEVRCDELYQGMLSFAKEGHYKGFESLSLADLTDKSVFEGLADDYAEFAVNNWPKFVDGTRS